MTRKIDVYKCFQGSCNKTCYLTVSTGLNINSRRCLDKYGTQNARFELLLPATYISLTSELANAMAYNEAVDDASIL